MQMSISDQYFSRLVITSTQYSAVQRKKQGEKILNEKDFHLFQLMANSQQEQ